MLLDLFDGSCPTEFDVDLCVVGAGAAGIALVQAFLCSFLRICLVESGGLAGELATQALCRGPSIGDPPFEVENSRLRAFGGSCNLWGGGCIPLGSFDLGARDWVPQSGWPLTLAELTPHYRRALAFCGLAGHELGDGCFAARPARPPLSFDPETLTHQVFVYTPTLFGERYLEPLRRADNVTVLLHANVLELEPTSAAGTAVARARIASLRGRRGTIRARYFVLACGGLENARLLLLSRAATPAGLGNRHDQVGRYFMDHPSCRLGTLQLADPDRFIRIYDRTRGREPTPAFPEIALSQAAQRRHRIVNGRVRPFAVERPVPAGLQALRDLRATYGRAAATQLPPVEAQICAALQHHEPPCGCGVKRPVSELGPLLWRLGSGAGELWRALERKLLDRPVVPTDHVDLIGYFEQAPNPESRVVLGPERDALGQPQICVDWRLTALDERSYRIAARLFGEELARVYQGRFVPEPWCESGPIPLTGTAHHLGTTRMADNPRCGVVDRDCRVHGVDNLYIAGSSVFPSGGWAFPTLALIALSLRLAAHLEGRLRPARQASNERPQEDAVWTMRSPLQNGGTRPVITPER